MTAFACNRNCYKVAVAGHLSNCSWNNNAVTPQACSNTTGGECFLHWHKQDKIQIDIVIFVYLWLEAMKLHALLKGQLVGIAIRDGKKL